MLKRHCDRCGHVANMVIAVATFSIRVILDQSTSEDRWDGDLCHDCEVELLNWLKIPPKIAKK